MYPSKTSGPNQATYDGSVAYGLIHDQCSPA
jgi:hypothetical protein